MTAAVTPAPAGRVRERLMVDFPVQTFLAKYPDVRKTDVCRALGVSITAMKYWVDRGETTMSVYKAIITLVDPKAAEQWELRLFVHEHDRVQVVTPQTAALAADYDARRAGAKFALKDGSGFYQIPAQLAVPKPPASKPAPAASQILASIQPKVDPDFPSLVDEYTQQQDVMLELLGRVTSERNQQAVELAQLRRRLADKDEALRVQADRIQTLERSVQEWEELAGKDVTRAGTFNGREIADDVVERLADLFRAKGAPHLTVELERLHPKRAGRLSS